MKDKISGLYAQFRETAEVMYLKGWAEAYAGNMSIRLDFEPGIDMSEKIDLPESFPSLKNITLLVTSSGSRMRHLREDPGKFICAIKISHDGGSYFFKPNNGLRPTSELIAHLKIHDALIGKRSQKKAVLHCHPDNIITIAAVEDNTDEMEITNALSSVHSEVNTVIPGGIGRIGLLEPGSPELASALGEKLITKDIIFVVAHGSFAAGSDLNEALDITEVADKAARIYLELLKFKIGREK